MTNRRRHTAAEISAKLEEANTLISQGKCQRDIARTLGISVMTFHRWRKAHAERTDQQSLTAGIESRRDSDQELRQRMADFQLENTRLRRLVTDLLLEKITLEDQSPSPHTPKGIPRGPASH
jgi:putative transposase